MSETDKDPHKVYHKFIKWLEAIDGDKMKGGYPTIEAIEKYAKDNPEIKIVPCDDEYFMSSIIVLVPHPKMGITVTFVPQCNSGHDNFFMYENHCKALVKALTEMQRTTYS